MFHHFKCFSQFSAQYLWSQTNYLIIKFPVLIAEIIVLRGTSKQLLDLKWRFHCVSDSVCFSAGL
jgi:hypothetical protein